MFYVDQLDQRLPEQVAGRWMSAFGPHGKLTNICKKSGDDYLISGKFRLRGYRYFYLKSCGCALFRSDELIVSYR